MHYTCEGEHFEKEQLFGKKYMFFLIAIGLPANFFSEIRQKLFTTGVQTVFCAYRGKVGAESFFWKKKHFFIVVRNFSNEKLGVLAKTRLQDCQNCVLCVQGNALRFVLKKIHFFSSLSEYEQKAIKLLAAISRQACLNCNLDVGGIISRKKNKYFSYKMYVPLHRFWTTGPFFSALWQKYSSTVVQTAFYLSIGGVWERLFIGESKFNFHFHKLM